MTKQPMADCPQCGGLGFTGFEEDTGRPFTCYLCCETGSVPLALAQQMQRDVELEHDRLQSLACRRVPCRIDEYDGCVARHAALFTRLDRKLQPAPQPALDFDDIPF